MIFRPLLRAIPAFLISLGVTSLVVSPAFAINKCTKADGSVSFQDARCPDDSKTTEVLKPRESTVGAQSAAQDSSARAQNTLSIIRTKCAREWLTDFSMRAYCERKQLEALEVLTRPQDLPQLEGKVIRIKCAQEWPSDFSMRAYCERKQVEGLRELNGR